MAYALGSLKLRITLCALAALVLGIGLTTLLLVHQAEQDTLALQRDRALADTVRIATLLSRRVVERQKALAANAGQIDAAMIDDPARLVALLDAKPLLRGLFSAVFVAGADGRIRVLAEAAGVRRSEVYLGDRDYFRLTLSERRGQIGEAVASRVSGDPVIVVTHPLGGSGPVHGVLGGVLNLATQGLIADLVEDDNADRVLSIVTDAHGHVLVHPSRERVLKDLDDEPRLQQAIAEWRRSGAPVEPAGLLLRQPGELVGAAGVAGPDWMVWRIRAESDLLAPLHAARGKTVLWAGGLIAVLSLVMLTLLFRLLQPLARLQERAGHLFDGTHEVTEGWPETRGEIGRLTRVLRHVTAERAQLEAFNAEVLRKLSSVMDAAPLGIAFTRAQRFELVSAEFCRLFALSQQQLLGQAARMIHVSDEDHAALDPQVSAAFARGEPYVGEWQMRRGDGSRFWAQLRARPVDMHDAGAGTIWSVADVTAQVAAREALEWSAGHDALTGLANRTLLLQQLERVLQARPRSLPAALVMVDLDRFKPINDRAGHAAGDAMLKAVAVVLGARVRASDLVVRLGGDEFALLLERCPHETALRIAEAARGAIQDIALPWQGEQLRVGASLGVASLTPETADAAAWMEAADAACYAAKNAGRGRVCAAPRARLRVVGGDAAVS
ncbi:diguanylate cyclase domain-containing protein [Piscinibacter defluvii]|uniref:diguanylate cyclase domain-containing protein n=1 Tax=Piscinibacter defluvii TaxID=1796922 RepID=UPI000FDEBF2C|nr:diguanylate cyclase [Piscinibacter defluvii]